MNGTFGEKLFILRKQHGYTPEELEMLADVSRDDIMRWERSEGMPTGNEISRLAQVFGVSADELAGGGSDGIVNKAVRIVSDTMADIGNKAAEKISGNIPKTGYAEPSDRPNINIETVPDSNTEVGFSFGTDLIDENAHEPYIPKKEPNWKALYAFPIYAAAIAAMMLMGFRWNAWSWSWLAILGIPLYYTTIAMLHKRKPAAFCYPVLMVILQMIGGFWFDRWETSWLWYLTIPFYYTTIVPYLKKHIKYFRRGRDKDNNK